jgi:hypothetical protein
VTWILDVLADYCNVFMPNSIKLYICFTMLSTLAFLSPHNSFYILVNIYQNAAKILYQNAAKSANTPKLQALKDVSI